MKSRTIIYAIVVAALVGVYFLATALPGKIEERRDARMKTLLTGALRSCLKSADGAFAGMVSISEVGSGRPPVSVYIAKGADSSDVRYGNDLIPVVPGSFLQTATLMYYLDNGVVTLDTKVPTDGGALPGFADKEGPYSRRDPFIYDYERMTGKDSITVREGYLSAYRYVTDRYVLDDINNGGTHNCHGFLSSLGEYFGTSTAYSLPSSEDQLPVNRSVLSVCDGYGVVLSHSQLLQFYGTLAAGGEKPGRWYSPKKRICQEAVADTIKALLRKNVLEGTGKMLRDCPVPVAAKNGSGYLADDGYLPGYGNIKDNEPVRMFSTIGFFPADNPKYTMCVTMYYDGVSTLASLTTFRYIVFKLESQGLL